MLNLYLSWHKYRRIMIFFPSDFLKIISLATHGSMSHCKIVWGKIQIGKCRENVNKLLKWLLELDSCNSTALRASHWVNPKFDRYKAWSFMPVNPLLQGWSWGHRRQWILRGVTCKLFADSVQVLPVLLCPIHVVLKDKNEGNLWETAQIWLQIH